MKNKGVLILGGAVLVLGLYAYFGEYKREQTEVKTKEETSKIIILKKDQIQKIDLQKGNGTLISLSRTVDGWDVTTPIQDQADNDTVEAFLDQISGEKAVDQIDSKNANLAEYGFKPSLGTITLSDNTGKKELIEVSSQKNFEGLVYLKKDQDPKILTSSQTWTSFLTKPADQFRNLKLFRGLISKVTDITLTSAKGSVSEFHYDNGTWLAPKKPDWKMDQNAIRQILTEATTAKGSGTITDKKFGPVGEHLLTLEFSGDKKTWKALLHQDSKSKDVIGAVTPANLIIRFPPQTLEELRFKTLIDFRDKNEPFHFERSLVHKMVVRSKIKSFTLVKHGEIWQLEKNDPNVTVNSTFAEEMVGKVNRLTAFRYLEKPAPSKLNLDSEIQFLGDNNEVVFQLSWSDFKEHVGFAQTNRFKEVFEIDDAQIFQLKLPEIARSNMTTTEHK
jgi:hypothetical protein